MKTYDRSTPTDLREIDRFEDGVGWLAHPTEGGRRASHAVKTDDGTWLLDPLWASGVEDLIESLEDEIVGVAVCSCWHARDADRFARTYDVPVYAPSWMSRLESRVNAPLERYRGDLEGIAVDRCEPFPGWSEAICYVESHDTLYVPDTLGTVDAFTVGDERIGLELARRLDPPRRLRTLEPDRILVGHGEGVLEDATRALEYALAGGRRRLPRAVLENGPSTLRSVVGALGG